MKIIAIETWTKKHHRFMQWIYVYFTEYVCIEQKYFLLTDLILHNQAIFQHPTTFGWRDSLFPMWCLLCNSLGQVTSNFFVRCIRYTLFKIVREQVCFFIPHSRGLIQLFLLKIWVKQWSSRMLYTTASNHFQKLWNWPYVLSVEKPSLFP